MRRRPYYPRQDLEGSKVARDQPCWALSRAMRVRDIAGFDKAMQEALARRESEYPDVTEEQLEQVADGMLYPPPKTITATTLLDVARAHNLPGLESLDPSPDPPETLH